MMRWCRFRLVFFMAFGMASANQLRAQKAPESPSPTAQGSALFVSNCAACHGSDGRGGERAPDIATVSEIQDLPNSDLEEIIRNGISGAGMPAFNSLSPEDIKGVVAYLRILQGMGSVSKLPGNPYAGEVLFFGKARCSSCHMVYGKGGFIAADLTHYGIDKTASQIRNIITDPDEYLPSSRPVTIVTRDGQKITGMIRNNDNFNISIQTMDGSFHFFQKAYLKQIHFDYHSLMPGNYSSTLNDREINDLISYLMNVGGGGTHDPGQSHLKFSEPR